MLARGRIALCPIPVLMILLAVAPQARAGESYLDVVPSSALIWGTVNHMDSAAGKLQELAKIVQIPATNLLDAAKKESGVENGLDEKGAAGFFAVPGKSEKDESVAAVFLAVKDEKEFLGNLDVIETKDKITEAKFKSRPGSEIVLAFIHGYAVFTPKRDRAAVEAAVKAEKSVAAEMAGYESWLAENDGSIVGTAAGIKYAAKQMGDELKKSKNNSEVATAELVQMMESFQKKFGSAVESAPKELSVVMAGIRYDKSAIRIIGRARLIQGGEVAKTISQMPPMKENLLSGVPGGPFVMSMAGAGIPGLMDSYANFTATMMKSMKSVYGMSDDELDQMTKDSVAAMRQVRSMAFVWKLGKRSDPLYSNIYMNMQVDDSKKLLDAQQKYADRNNKLLQNMKNSPMKGMEVKPLTIAGKQALEQDMTFDFSSVPGAPQAGQAMFDAMLGVGGKMIAYYMAANDHTVIAGIGVPQEKMVAAMGILDQPKRSLAEDADVATTAALLPEKPQWVAYISFRGFAQVMIRTIMLAMKNTPGAGLENFNFPVFPKSPPLGLAMKATADEIHAEIAVPTALVQATGDYVKDFQAAFMRQMMERNNPPAP